MKNTPRYLPWIYWIVLMLGASAYLAYTLLGDNKEMYLMGEMTHGHHQIEMACSACHTSEFGGAEVMQDACVNCHGEELKVADDSHPKSKFTDPRNADRLEQLDARYCVTCHTEHRPELTQAMGVTLPDDYCFYCHQDIAEERPTHKDLGFDTCASSGCHNFHDNRALYEDFLVKHANEDDIAKMARVGLRNFSEVYPKLFNVEAQPLTAQQMDAPSSVKVDALDMDEWSMSGHASSGVNCSDCHNTKESGTPQTAWTNNPDHKACESCHASEVKGFLSGKHGMRLEQNLSPMSPDLARLPMKNQAGHQELNCSSCHGAHRFDTKYASVDACMSCHNDEHTLAYKNSKHYALWRDEVSGEATPGSGVSCASCHMPRETHQDGEIAVVKIQHNQNDNLRPNEKMIRSVCMSCHGLDFSLNSLADAELVKKNFTGRTSMKNPGPGWARSRVAEDGEE